MKKMYKRGLSPVIATVLLIAIALVLAIIIFLWARTFIGEAISKEKYGRIEQACPDISFKAEGFIGADGVVSVNLVNNGDVPIYGIEIRKKGLGSIESVEKFGSTIGNGQTVSVNATSGSLNDEIQVVPIIVGTSGETKKTYTCADSLVDVKVQSS